MKTLALALAASTASLALAVPTIAIAQAQAAKSLPPSPADIKAAQTVADARDSALRDDTVAWDIVEGLTTEIGQRMAGTEAEERARLGQGEARRTRFQECPHRTLYDANLGPRCRNRRDRVALSAKDGDYRAWA